MKLTKRGTLTLSIFGALLALSGAPAHSAAAPPPSAAEVQELRNQLAALTARLKALEARETAKAPPASKAKASAKAKTDGAARSGSADEALDVRLKTVKNSGDTLQDLSDAFDVPESPAAAVLGISSDKVQHLKTPKQLVPAIINGLDEKGNFQSGLAVDFAPYQWWMGSHPMEEFRGADPDDPRDIGFFRGDGYKWFKRALLRTQLSFATTKGSSDADKSSKFAVGLHTVLFNADDPLITATSADEKAEPFDARGLELNHWVLGHRERVNEHGERLFATHLFGRAAEYLWSHSSMAIGAAPSWISEGDGNDSYRFNGATYWTSFAYVPSRAQAFRLLLNVMYRQDEELPAPKAAAGAPKAAAVEQDTLFVVGGVRFGSRDFNATATAAWLSEDRSDGKSDDAFRFGLQIEKRVSANSFITLSISKETGRDDGDNPTLVLGGVKFGLGGNDFTTADQKVRAIAHGDL